MTASVASHDDDMIAWPEKLASAYRRAGYWQGRSITSHIHEQVMRRPDAQAVIDGDTRYSYRQIWARSEAFAQYLIDNGIGSGDRIVLQLPNCWEFVAVTLGCWLIGVVPVMALPSHRRHEMDHVVSLSNAKVLVIADRQKDTDLRPIAQQVAADNDGVEQILIQGELSGSGVDTPERDLSTAFDKEGAFDGNDHEPAGADLAMMLLSGGTTGMPKLIPRTHDDYAYNIMRCGDVGGFDETTTYMVSLPASHNFPLGSPGFLAAMFRGGRVVMLPSPSSERALATIDAESVTATAVVPAIAHSWIECQRDSKIMQGNSLEVLQVGGSRMPDELAPRVKTVLGATLQQVFGNAEGLINMTRLDDPEEAINGTQGRPVSEADEIRIVDEVGEPVADGMPGSLLTQGPYTIRGYYKAPEANEKSFVDGWYATGDIVIRRTDGNLVVAGRDKDMINRGGENISAEEVESIVYQLDGIEVAAAVSMPDPILGERVCLYVTTSAGHEITLDDVVAVMEKAGVARYKIPERLVAVDRIPMTKVGKINKKALREDIAHRMDDESDQMPTA